MEALDSSAHWEQCQDPLLDGELGRLGSPLLTVPTPSRDKSSRLSTNTSVYADSSAEAQHVSVVVRVKPPKEGDTSCLDWDDDLVTISPPGEDAPVRTPAAGRTPGHEARTPGAATPGARTPAARTPGGRTPGGRTPGAQTPGGTGAPVGPKRMIFDGVCGPEASQEDLFDQARPLIDAALGGSNACIFAYGQTGAGKTFTMAGTNEAPGVVPRALERVWDCIEASPNAEWHVSLTYVELYNDGWRDLLAPYAQPGQRMLPMEIENARRLQSKIHLREIPSAAGRPARCYLEGSETFRTPVRSLEELRQLVANGTTARAVGTTNLNERSSRSHSVITLNLDSRPAGSSCLRTGKLHLVDLAGSEAQQGVGTVLTTETSAINVSLNALCNVLQQLSKNARRPRGTPAQPVPYRDHKITRLLADSLGGNSHTLMIAAVQTCDRFYRSTLTTLKFASRARDITMVVQPNEEVLGADSSALSAKIEELKVRRVLSAPSARLRLAEQGHLWRVVVLPML